MATTNGVMINTLQQQASKLLDFNEKLDIDLLDNVVNLLYSGGTQEVCAILLLYRKCLKFSFV